MNEAISIVVPTFNEAEGLPKLLRALKAALDGRLDYEVVLADDRSPDGTAQVAEAVAREISVPLRVVTREGPRSLALSVLEGARAARRSCVVVMDADLSHDPAEVPLLAREVLEGRADVAVGSRYVPGGAVRSWPLRRRLLSGLGSSLARLVAPVADPLSGFFACRRELLAGGVELRPRGYKVLLELLARAPGLRVVEVPVQFEDRRRGRSKLALRQTLEFLAQVLSLIGTRVSTRIHFGSQVHKPRRAFS